jgi:hypothetical protein
MDSQSARHDPHFFRITKMYLTCNAVSFLAFASKDKIWVYRYDLKKDHELPKLIVNCTHSHEN